MHRLNKETIYHLLEADPEKPGAGRILDVCILMLIVANVIAVILESVEGLYIPHATFFQAFDIFSVAVFTVEYLLRLWTCTANPDYANPVLGRLRYAATPLAIIDLLAILPFFLPMFIPLDLRIMRALRLLRVFRILKISRYSYALKLLGRVMKAQVHVIGVLIFILVLLVVITSSLMFFVEHDVQPDDFANIPTAMWWAVATLSTVGYGDVFPVTPLGKALGGLIALLGIGMFALPAGVLSSAFLEEIQKNGGGERGNSSHSRSPEEVVDLLERLALLREEGVLTDEEVAVQKQRVLGDGG
ncbi:ion transporter [Methanoculleus bourgensis]|nr:ion transporter [Methanoculleus bourgensis]